MQVKGVDGDRALSVASFIKCFRKDVANRVIAAPINGNDGTIMQLWAEHVWEKVHSWYEKDNPNLLSHIRLASGEKFLV
jgi:hypothetical protein